MLPSVNYHLWEPCNMRCKFCFATFQDVKKTILPKGHLTREESISVVRKLAEAGFEKITFVGGEPTLCPWLDELIMTAKTMGLTTMIVTNGTNLSDEFLHKNRKFLDWISISVDSIIDQTNLETGRAIIGKKVLTLDDYKAIVTRIKNADYGLKINTVVNANNKLEDLSSFIEFAQPQRWKIFQALPISGQNDLKIDSLVVSETEFLNYIQKHQDKLLKIKIVAENNRAMTGTYAMVDPAGRFFDNVNNSHNYSSSILKNGAKAALSQVNYNLDGFLKRQGKYDWLRP